jgi:hypothetical protein
MTINDITGSVCILLGLIVGVLSFRTAITCPIGRWVYYLNSFAGFMLAVVFSIAVINSFQGGAGLVSPEIGRPSIIVALTAMAASAITTHRQGGCK